MLKKSLAWLLTVALCMSVFAGCGAKKTLPPVNASSSKVTEDKVEEKPAQASDTLVVTTAGAVTPAAGIKHVIIEADGVILENAKLETITVSEKLGEGTATLKNVKAKILNANGGGEHSIIILDSDLVTIIANRKDGKQHITINVGSTVTTFTIESEVIADIEGAVEKLVVEDGAKNPEVNILASSRVVEMLIKALTAMQIDAEVESVSITGDAENSTMEVGKGGKVGTLATDVPMTTSGDGAIGTLVTNNKNNLKGSTLAANTTTINQNPLNKDVAEAQPIVKKKPGAVTPPVTPPPAADEAPVSGKIELAIIGAEAFPKPYDGTDIAYVTGVDFANLQNGDVLHRGTDYLTYDVRFEDVNIGKNKKILGTVALLPTEKTAKYNLKDGNLVNVTADIFKSVPHNQFTDLVKGFAATVPYSASIDLSKFFKKGVGAGAESYTVVAKAPAAHSSKDAANLVVTACGNFEVSFKTAATDKGDEDKGNLKFTLTVSKIPGTAIAEKLVVVKPTAEGSNDGKITGLDSKKLYEYTTNSGISYTAVAANATEITGLYARKYTVRYKGTGSDIKDEGIGTEITIINPEKSEVSFVAMEQTKTVLGKLVSELQSADTVAEPDGVYRFKGELNKIDSWPEFGTNTGYFIALQVNPKVGTTFTDAAELKLYKSNGTEVNGTALLKKDNEIVLHVADALPNPGKQFKVTIDLDGAGADYETTTYTLGTGGLTLAGTNDVALTVKVDSVAADVAGIGVITIQKGAATPITLTEEGTSNVYKHATVPTGVYMIFVGGIDTRQTLNVNGATITTGDLLYYTVTLNAPTGVTAGSTLKASYGAGVDIPTGTPLLKDTEITLTANVDPKAPNTTYSSVFSNGATKIGEAVAGVPAKATFKLAEKLDANVAITATLAPTKITAVADLVVTAPVKKAVPAAATLTGANADYAVTSTVWNVAGEGGAVEATAFKPGTSYTATVTLTAAAGKTFSGDIVPTGTLTGANAILKGTISPIDTAQNTIVFKITYPALAAAVAPTATVAVTGDAKVGATLTATPTITDNDFLGTTVTYKWYTSDDAVVGGVDDKVIASATTSTYVLTAADAGKCIYCEVTPNNGGKAANSLPTSAVAEKTNDVALTVKVDGAAADVAGIGEITIQKGAATPIALTEEGTTNVYKNATVPTGVYKILVGGVDTRQTLNVNQATSTTGDLLYYTVTLNAPTGVTAGSTLKASYGAGVDIPTGTPLLKDTEITLTANVNPEAPNTTYTYAFSDGTTPITAVAGAPTTAKFMLTKALDAKVEITATVGVAKITAVADLVVTQPAKNVKPADATVTNADYAVTSTVWNVAGVGGAEEKLLFKPGTSYTATVTLKAAAGKAFSGDIVPTGALTGANAILNGTISPIDKAENTIVFKITYPALAAAVLPTATVAVTGDAKVGATLTATPTITHNDFPSTTVTYKWYRSADDKIGGDTAIGSATAETYVLTAADHSQYIYCEVTPNNGGVATNSTVTVAIAKGDAKRQQPVFKADALSAGADVKVTTTAGTVLNTTTLSFEIYTEPANALTNLEFKFAAAKPEVTDATGWTQAAATVADVAYNGTDTLYIRAKADDTAMLNPSVATPCTGLVITVLTAAQVAQQDAINKVKAMFDDASTLTIDMLDTATGTTTAKADNLVAYKAAVEACTAATELETKELIAAIVKGVNDAVAAIESNTSVTEVMLKKATGLATINNYTACAKAITAATTAGTLNTSVLINAMVVAVDAMETAAKAPQTATVANTVAAETVLTTTIGGTTYTVSAPVITTPVYLKVDVADFKLAKVNDTAADVTEKVTFTWTDKTLTYITHELVPCTVTIKQTAKGIANADIAAAKLELEKDAFYTTISMANGEATADTTIKVQALVTNALATTLKNTTCTVTAEATGNVVRVDGTKLAPISKDGVYNFKVKITKTNGAEQTTKVMTITTAATAYAVNDITETALTLTAPDSANAAAVTAPTGILNCTSGDVVWTDASSTILATGTSFVKGTVYTATFTLTASDHYKFATTFAPTCTVSGATVTQTITGGDVENNKCEVKITFPAATGV